MTAGAEHIPEHRWARSRRPTFNTDCRRAFEQFGFGLASRGDARQITLDVGGKHRHAHLRETFGEHLQRDGLRSEEHTSELQSLMRISYAVFCLKKKTTQ